MRRGVEPVGQDPVGRSRLIRTIRFALDRGAMRLNGMQDIGQQPKGGGTHDDLGPRRILSRRADLHLFDVEGAAHH